MYRIKETLEAVNKISQLMKDGSSYVNEHPEVCMIPILSQIAISIAVIADCIDRVDDEETVPVSTAKWEHYRNGQLSCSECGENAPVIERWYCNGEDDFPKYESWGTPYCPFCGSRMVNGEK